MVLPLQRLKFFNMKKEFANVQLVLNTDQLQELAEYLLERLQPQQKSEESGKDELRPLSYWSETLKVDRSTLWRWAKDGRITPTKVGKRTFYKQSDFTQKGGVK